MFSGTKAQRPATRLSLELPPDPHRLSTDLTSLCVLSLGLYIAAHYEQRLLNVPALSIQRMQRCHLPTVSKPLSIISLGELGARLLPNHLSEEAHVIPDHPSTIISVSCLS